MLIDVSSDFKTTQLAAGVSVRGCGTPVATTLRGPTAFGSRRSAPGTSHRPERRAQSPLAGGAAPRNLPGSSAGMVTRLDRGSPPRQPACRRGIEEPTKDRLKKVNLRHAARDTLLFYTGHRCRHICPVCAKLPAPANDAGFRTVETISVHGEGICAAARRDPWLFMEEAQPVQVKEHMVQGRHAAAKEEDNVS
ncbi:hypothetical protein Bbelb_018070 [Branchiostoma belcheri]|nr:hypothetical protein Bbelb_018070 [Branchiostoma belcheri]